MKKKIIALFKEIADEYYQAQDTVIDERSTDFINDRKEITDKVANWEKRLRLLLDESPAKEVE